MSVAGFSRIITRPGPDGRRAGGHHYLVPTTSACPRSRDLCAARAHPLRLVQLPRRLLALMKKSAHETAAPLFSVHPFIRRPEFDSFVRPILLSLSLSLSLSLRCTHRFPLPLFLYPITFSGSRTARHCVRPLQLHFMLHLFLFLPARQWPFNAGPGGQTSPHKKRG